MTRNRSSTISTRPEPSFILPILTPPILATSPTLPPITSVLFDKSHGYPAFDLYPVVDDSEGDRDETEARAGRDEKQQADSEADEFRERHGQSDIPAENSREFSFGTSFPSIM